MVNLEWYRTFIAIYEKNTLTRAAESLFTSQPGVSVHLNALESYVGRKLFERTSRKMIPTEDGKQLYNFVLDAVKKLERAEQHFKKTSKEEIAAINIGMCTETFQAILEPEIPALEFNLMAKFGDHQALIKDLNNEILDLVITPINDKKSSLVTFEAFTKEHIVLVAGKETDLTKIKDLIARDDLEELEKALKKKTWFSASNDMDHFRRFWYENFKRRADFKPNYILPNIGSIIRSIENNDGFAIVPDFLAQESLQAGKIQLVWAGVKEVSNILYFATRKDLKYKEETEVIKNIFRRKMKDLR